MQLAILALTTDFYFDYYQRSLKTDTTLSYVRNNNLSYHKLQQLQKTRTQQNLPITKNYTLLSGIINNTRCYNFDTVLKQTLPKITQFLFAFKSTSFSQFTHTVNIITLQHINLNTAKLISLYRFYRRKF